MAGRYATGHERPERHNEYFLPGEGISREVIQADICRYLGNDALVKPGTHNGRQGYLIRAYRNLTTEMINDLKNDSSRWEAEVARRADMGYARGTYFQDVRRSRSPNTPPAPYASSSIHELRQQGGPSPQNYPAAPTTYVDPTMYGQATYGTAQTQAYGAQTYPTSQSPYGSNQNPYGSPPQNPYTGQNQPPVSSSDVHPTSYTYTSSNPYSYSGGTAPRYAGPTYQNENDSDYSPVTSSMVYPAATAAPDTRIGMGYGPDTAYQDHRAAQANRQQQTRDREPRHRQR